MSPAFDAEFPLAGSSVVFSINMTNDAAAMNIVDIFMKLVGSPVSTDDLASYADDVKNAVAQIGPLGQAAHEFYPLPKSKGAYLRATAAAAVDLVKLINLNADQRTTLKALVKKITKGQHTLTDKKIDGFINKIGTLKDLLLYTADILAYGIATQGYDITVSFAASFLQ